MVISDIAKVENSICHLRVGEISDGVAKVVESVFDVGGVKGGI